MAKPGFPGFTKTHLLRCELISSEAHPHCSNIIATSCSMEHMERLYGTIFLMWENSTEEQLEGYGDFKSSVWNKFKIAVRSSHWDNFFFQLYVLIEQIPIFQRQLFCLSVPIYSRRVYLFVRISRKLYYISMIQTVTFSRLSYKTDTDWFSRKLFWISLKRLVFSRKITQISAIGLAVILS